MTYWIKSPGTGGSVIGEEDFVVEEIPLKKFFLKFQRTASGVVPTAGPYSLWLLKKRGITTKDALAFVAKKFHLKRSDIGYAGLKDKFAVTSQYITIKGEADEFKNDGIELTKIGPTNSFMAVGELEGNRFTITLRNCKKAKNVEAVVHELEKRGMPNYFGPQRFGTHGDNHKIGLLLLKRGFDSALVSISRNYGKKYRSIHGLNKKMLKFFIHAYQSHVFNRVLDSYIANNDKPLFDDLPIVGYGTKLKNFAGKETEKILASDGLTPESFRIGQLGITATGSRRSAFVDVKNIKYKVNSNTVVLEFFLPKGSYATVLIREVVKDGHV